MNILIPHTWLLEHLDTEATPEEIQRILSLSGPSVERIYDKPGDKVYDIEVTTNRVDSMSVRGIAREAAVILSHAGIPSKLKERTNDNVRTHSNVSLQIPKISNNESLCPRIMCVVLSNVKRAETPDWMAERLTQTDQNIHHAAIDITNYITHDLGHPCHAFDYDKIMKLGGEIIIKEAEAGKKFTTLDGIEYETVGGEIVYENQHGEIIDLPGIKGTANTAIDDSTTNVLFWIESVNAKKVRFASMTHAIRTVAAQLNEKNVDPHLAEDVLHRGIELFQQLCSAEIASEIYDDFPGKKPLQSIEVSMNTINNYLGIEIPVEDVTQILEELGCEVQLTTDNRQLTTHVPTFRPDLTIPADIVEEVARIYGYHNLPSVLMDTAIPLTKQDGVDIGLEQKIKHFLVNIGWQELYTYSMVSEELAKQSGIAIDEHVKIQNPLTDDRVYMRTSLIPSLNEVIDQHPLEKSISVFELAHSYVKTTDSLPVEELQLSMVSTKPYRQVKGDLESLLDQFFIKNLSIREGEVTNNSHSQEGEILVGKDSKKIGEIRVLQNQRIAIVMPIKELISHAESHPSYTPTPTTALIIEDLTFTLPEKTALGTLITAVQNSSSLIVSCALKDQYQQNYTFTISYQDPQQNLDASKITAIRADIISAVKDQFDGTLVGSV